jgi:hypothetical protein
MHELPISESYWVEPGRFLAGEYPGRFDANETHQRIQAFLSLGIATFFDLTRPDELPPYWSLLLEEARAYGLEARYQRFPIVDFGLPNRAGMLATLDAIDSALAADRKIYVHCWGGIGRTGTTVGCYLVRHGRTGAQALRQLEEWWQNVPKSSRHPTSPETKAQMQFVLDWKE